MRLIQVLCMVLTQLSVGSLLFASLLPQRIIRTGFFTLNCLIAAISAALAMVLTKTLLQTAWWDVRYLGLTVIGATLAWGLFRLDKLNYGRLVMILSALVGLVAGVWPLAGAALRAREMQTTAIWFFDAGVLSGTLLIGATHVGMILGHWYLLMRRLSFEYLQRFTQLLIGATLLRGAVLVTTLLLLDNADPLLAGRMLPAFWSAGGLLFFLVIRVVLGIVLPFVLAIMVLRCVQREANQAATGLLYVAEICVLFGELFAAYLLV